MAVRQGGNSQNWNKGRYVGFLGDGGWRRSGMAALEARPAGAVELLKIGTLSEAESRTERRRLL